MNSVITERYLEFVGKVAGDRNLNSWLEAIQPGDSRALLTLAASKGYIFTAEELKEASLEARRLFDKGNDELSEAELEVVSGGNKKPPAKGGHPVVIAIIAILIG
jgi:predicted ribosomally synthesized peptide with nif11-like leader